MGHPKKNRSKEANEPLATIWEVPDALWERVEPVLSEHDPRKRTGRPRVNERSCLNAIIFRLRTGCQWNHLPKEFPDDSSVHRTFQRWVLKGVFEKVWAVLVEECDELGGVDWEWQSADARMGKALADGLAAGGLRIVSGGTDNHLCLVDLTATGKSGKKAENALDAVGITVNKNMIPFDTRKALVTSGIRVGSAAVTTRGMGETEMGEIAALIVRALDAIEDPDAQKAVLSDVHALCARFPLYTH